eukprot:c16853_g1_i3 orf=501-1136(-)
MKRSNAARSRGIRVAWDEANLDYLEATKSPKKKIMEPKTPYHAPEDEDGTISPFLDEDVASLDNAAHAEAIRNALNDFASTSCGQRRPRGGHWTSSEDEADEMDHDSEGLGSSVKEHTGEFSCLNTLPGSEANGNRLSFKEQRKVHYDEFRKVKMLRQQSSKLNDPCEGGNWLQGSGKPGQHQASLEGGMGAIGLQENISSGSSDCGSGQL